MDEIDGIRHFRLHRRALSYYAEMYLRDRNKFNFIYKPWGARSEIYAKYPRGTRYQDGQNFWWLPIECVNPNLIVKVQANKLENGFYKDYCATRELIPNSSRITENEFEYHFRGLLGEGSERFYGVVSAAKDGPEPLKTYL